MNESLKNVFNNISSYIEEKYDAIYANLFGYKKKYRQRNKENRMETLFLYIGCLIILCSIIWFVNESKDKEMYFYEDAITLSTKDEKNNVYISYNYGFTEMTDVVNVPFYVSARENSTIPIKFLKDDITIVEYGKDNRLPAFVIGGMGIGLILIAIMSLQGKEEKRKLKNQKAMYIYKNDINENENIDSNNSVNSNSNNYRLDKNNNNNNYFNGF